MSLACFVALVFLAANPDPRDPAPVVGAAEPSEQEVARAREHFDAGNAHYAAGRYAEAIAEFQAGYALAPRPSFLLNMGQSYRKLGDLTRAKDAYLRYLRSLPDDSPLRDQALQVLAEIEVQLQESGKPAPAEVVPARVQPEPSPSPTPAPEPPRARVGSWVAFGLFTTGLVMTGTGAVFQLLAKQASDELTALDRQMGLFDPARERAGLRYERAGIVLMATGGVALVASGLLHFFGRDERGGGSGRVALAPLFAPGFGGGQARVTF